jgi:hypothetical protein
VGSPLEFMPIFLLVPQELEAPDWAMSAYRGPVQADAQSEHRARRCAALRYALISGGRNHRHGIGALAWRMPRLVRARIVNEIDPEIELIC